mmetsp:Transcript_123275/g.239803  ORF Transcript_123275/g.239803 Transcript_123275/m.239803 type:complete len:559 (-) Transcript_123275:6-1682(-)
MDTAAAAGALAACPVDYFRTDAVVWNCSGATGSAFHPMSPNQLEKATSIPEGVNNFSVNVSADVDFSLQLVKSISGEEFFGYTGDRVNSMETLRVPGRLSTPLGLKIRNYASSADTAILHYRYDGISGCPQEPPGCSRFDKAKASKEVRSWSCWVGEKYGSADKAWTIMAQPEALMLTKTVPWHRFRAVWERWPWNGDNHGWARAFAALDVDRDQEISRTEFAAGYNLCSAPNTSATGDTSSTGNTSATGSTATRSAAATRTSQGNTPQLPGWATLSSVFENITDNVTDNGTLAVWDLQHWSSSGLVALPFLLGACLLCCILAMFACRHRRTEKPLYQSLPKQEADETDVSQDRVAPEPERAIQIEEPAPPLHRDPPWSYRPVPRLKTIMSAVPRMVMRPLVSPPQPLTSLVEPFKNVSLVANPMQARTTMVAMEPNLAQSSMPGALNSFMPWGSNWRGSLQPSMPGNGSFQAPSSPLMPATGSFSAALQPLVPGSSSFHATQQPLMSSSGSFQATQNGSFAAAPGPPLMPGSGSFNATPFWPQAHALGFHATGPSSL